MSELVQMRQRIKSIETIKKVTHAMRLISMAKHNKFRTSGVTLKEYQHAMLQLLKKITTLAPYEKNPIAYPSDDTAPALAIVIGSQKGLCGNFTMNALSLFAQHTKNIDKQSLHIIPIGKKTVDLIEHHYGTVVLQFQVFTTNTIMNIAKKITDHIINAKQPYRSVHLYYNYPKTFFAQKPQIVTVIPFIDIGQQDNQEVEEYHWEHNPSEIITVLIRSTIQTTIQEACLTSLIAEQAARFIAMDNSTKNASNLLDAMKLEYNKTRQTNITRELTDLISGL